MDKKGLPEGRPFPRLRAMSLLVARPHGVGPLVRAAGQEVLILRKSFAVADLGAANVTV